MKIKVSDYLVNYMICQGVTDVFGYPGGMVTQLMDSLGKNKDRIKTHITYHEQAASFAACGYAQASGRVGVAFSTSGPGATNLITGIGNAFYDSIPVVFITGQVNTFESKKGTGIRQKGFQETDIVSMVKSITKAAFYIDDPNNAVDMIEAAFRIANEDRKGPVLIDIPMNIFKTEIEEEKYSICETEKTTDYTTVYDDLTKELSQVLKTKKRPCLLIGNGIKICRQTEALRGILRSCPMPVVSSMIAVDVIPEGQGLEGLYYGFVGAYGNRTANFVVAKSDLLICLGSRLDVRQVGGKREQFAPNATIIRIDIDENELENVIRKEEKQFIIPLDLAIAIIRKSFSSVNRYEEWIQTCKEIKNQVKYIDEKEPNRFINEISKIIPDGYNVSVDVGQNMVWVAQSYKFKPAQSAFFSGGMGSMGYALPAAIGIYYATHKPVICFVGDGGLQMNIQEMQLLVRDNIPIKIIVVNNKSLGMIRHFQEMYFEGDYQFTVEEKGYSVPDFVKVAEAYGIVSRKISNMDELKKLEIRYERPELIELLFEDNTVISPKLEFGKPNQDQEPLLDRSLYNYLMEL